MLLCFIYLFSWICMQNAPFHSFILAKGAYGQDGLHFLLSDDVFPVSVLHCRILLVLFLILSKQLCASVHCCFPMCACLLHSRRLISPAGLVRLFLGALSSQLEATTITCLANIAPLTHSTSVSLVLPSPILISVITKDATYQSGNLSALDGNIRIYIYSS